MAGAELRPLRIGEILDVSIKIYLRNAKTLFLAVLVVQAPLQVISFFVLSSTAPDGLLRAQGTGAFGGSAPRVTPDDFRAYFAGILVIGLLSLVATALATATCLKAVSDAYLGQPASWRASLGFAFRRLRSLLWLGFLLVLFLSFAALALVVPAIWLYIAWSVAFPVLLLEGERGTAALRRSFRLVRHRWWPTLGALMVGFILAGIVGAVVSGIFTGLASLGAKSSPILVLGLSSLGGLISGVLSRPFQAAVITVLYFDLRVRKEGFDLQLLAERLGVTDVRGTSPAPPTVALPSEADRAQAPFWPPPPGWRPPGASGAPAPSGPEE